MFYNIRGQHIIPYYWRRIYVGYLSSGFCLLSASNKYRVLYLTPLGNKTRHDLTLLLFREKRERTLTHSRNSIKIVYNNHSFHNPYHIVRYFLPTSVQLRTVNRRCGLRSNPYLFLFLTICDRIVLKHRNPYTYTSCIVYIQTIGTVLGICWCSCVSAIITTGTYGWILSSLIHT